MREAKAGTLTGLPQRVGYADGHDTPLSIVCLFQSRRVMSIQSPLDKQVPKSSICVVYGVIEGCECVVLEPIWTVFQDRHGLRVGEGFTAHFSLLSPTVIWNGIGPQNAVLEIWREVDG